MPNFGQIRQIKSSASLRCAALHRTTALQFIQYIGRYTLYIFLYHTLILDMLLPELTFLDSLPGAVKTFSYMAVMILLPIAGKELYDFLKRRMRDKAGKEERALKENLE